jgi:hypothetical protein
MFISIRQFVREFERIHWIAVFHYERLENSFQFCKPYFQKIFLKIEKVVKKPFFFFFFFFLMVSLHVHPATVSLLRNVHEHLPGVVEQSNELTVSLIVWCESRGACL